MTNPESLAASEKPRLSTFDILEGTYLLVHFQDRVQKLFGLKSMHMARNGRGLEISTSDTLNPIPGEYDHAEHGGVALTPNLLVLLQQHEQKKHRLDLHISIPNPRQDYMLGVIKQDTMPQSALFMPRVPLEKLQEMDKPLRLTAYTVQEMRRVLHKLLGNGEHVFKKGMEFFATAESWDDKGRLGVTFDYRH